MVLEPSAGDSKVNHVEVLFRIHNPATSEVSPYVRRGSVYGITLNSAEVKKGTPYTLTHIQR
jgi:hypothetical protein